MKRGISIAIILIVLLAGFAVFALVQLDPIRTYVRYTNGGMQLSGSISGALFNYLQHGPTHETSITTWVPDSFGMKTAGYRQERLNVEPSGIAPQPSNERFQFHIPVQSLNAFVASIKSMIAWVLFGWYTQNSQAVVCGDGIGSNPCFWIGGTGNFSNASHWAATSGGAAGVLTPAATDTITFDASSGAGTATQDNATFTSGAVVMTNSSVTVAGGTNTWKIGGSYSDGNNHGSMATATLEFTATGSLAMHTPGGCEYGTVIIDSSVTTTPSTYLWVCTTFTVNGTWAGNTGKEVLNNGDLTLGGSANVSNLNYYSLKTGTTLPGGTYLAVRTDRSMTLGGNLTVTSNAMFGVSLFVAGTSGSIASGTVSVIANSVQMPAAANYITSSSSGSWTVSGVWSNASTSASWNFQAPITFNSSANQTMTFGVPTNYVSAQEFRGNVTFDSTATGSTAITYTMATNALVFGGTLTLQQTGASSGTMTLATSNLGLSVGALTVGNKAVLTANTSTVSVTNVTMTGGTSGTITCTSGTWTVSGNWDTSGAGSTFTKGTSGITLSGTSKTVKTLNSSNGFYDLTTSGTITESNGTDISHSWLVSGGSFTTAGFAVTGGSNLIVSSSGTLTGSTASLTVSGVTMTDGTASTISLTSGTINNTGNWDTSGATSTFTKGTSIVALQGSGKTVKILNASNGFYDLNTSGTITQSNAIDVSHTLTVSGTLTTSGNNVSGGADLSDIGTLVSSSAVLTLSNVTIGAVGTWTFTNGSATVSGNWDSSNASATFTKGTSLVILSGTSKTVAIRNSSNGFYSLNVTGTISQTTLIDVSSTLQVTGSLATSGNTISGGSSLVFTSSGTLTGTSATMTFGDVTLSAGTLSATSATINVSGNWDSTSGTFTTGTSLVHMTGTSKTIKTTFYDLTVSGTETLAANLVITHNLLVDGTLNTSGSNYSVQVNNNFTITGTFIANASTVTMNGGNFDSSAGTFTYGTSTLSVNATATLTTAISTVTFYHVTIAAGVTVTLPNQDGMAGTLTMGNNSTLNQTGGRFYFENTAGIIDPIVVGTGVTITHITMLIQSGVSVDIPSATYSSILEFQDYAGTISGDGFSYLATGDLIVGTLQFTALTKPAFFQSNTYNMTITTITDLAMVSSPSYGIKATSGTWTVGDLSIGQVASTGFYIQSGSTVWTVTLHWGNGITTNSSKWDAGTSVVHFTAVGDLNYYFAGSHLSVPEFYDMTVESSNTITQIYFHMAGDLNFSHQLTIQDMNGAYSVLDTTVSNYSITGGSITIASGGSIQAFASVITLNGNFDSSAICWVQRGTSTIVWATNGTISVNDYFACGSVAQLWNVTINGSVTLTNLSSGQMTIENSFVINGTLLGGSPNDPQKIIVVFGFGSTGTPATFVTIGGSGDVHQSGYFIYAYIGSSPTFAIAAGTYQHIGVEGIADTIAYLQGDLTTPNCGSEINCAFILRPIYNFGDNFTFYTNNHTISIGGTIYIGDANNTPTFFHAGSSTITCYGLGPNGRGILYGETAHFIVYPNARYSPYAFIMSSGPGIGNNAGVIAGSATFQINGDVHTFSVNDYFDLGSSAWTVTGNWTNISTSGSWSGGTSNITLSGNGKTLNQPVAQMFHHLTISGTGMSITNNVKFDGTFNLSGTATKNSFAFAGLKIENGSGGSYVLGTILKWGGPAGTYTWLQTATGANPITITFHSTLYLDDGFGWSAFNQVGTSLGSGTIASHQLSFTESPTNTTIIIDTQGLTTHVFDYLFIFGFFALLILLIIGAYAISKKRGR